MISQRSGCLIVAMATDTCWVEQLCVKPVILYRIIYFCVEPVVIITHACGDPCRKRGGGGGGGGGGRERERERVMNSKIDWVWVPVGACVCMVLCVQDYPNDSHSYHDKNHDEIESYQGNSDRSTQWHSTLEQPTPKHRSYRLWWGAADQCTM